MNDEPQLEGRTTTRAPRSNFFFVISRLNVYIFRDRKLSEALDMSFTRMDQGKIEDWMAIGQAVTQRQASMPGIIKTMLLQLEEQVDGFAVNQLHHCLQTATRALREGAPEEMIVAALCHDIGKVISVEN